jgi:hypothetical protein
LHREGKTTVRLQSDLVTDDFGVINERIKNQLPYFGDDMMSTHALFYMATGGNPNPLWMEGHRLMARFGWRAKWAGRERAAVDTAIANFEQINREFDITGLRWTLLRPNAATHAQLDRLKAIGATVSVGGSRYPNAAANNPAGAPFRTVVDNGIPAGIHMDGGHIATLNPWICSITR